jgi:hypothetical protein
MKKIHSMPIVDQYGLMWARNKENLKELPRRKKGGEGVYLLYDGSMPVYAGRGGFRNRIKMATTSIKRAQMWDHFSWFSVKDRRKHHDLEMLMLQILPPMLRSANRQNGKFAGPQKQVIQALKVPEVITRILQKRKCKCPSRKS